jgi:putative ABC transport system permease protein
MNTLFLKLGWKTLLRDLRAGELRLLIVAVTLAVASLTATGSMAVCSATPCSCWAATR